MIGTCSFRVANKKNKEHSEMTITHEDAVNKDNSIIYQLESFNKALEEVAK